MRLAYVSAFACAHEKKEQAGAWGANQGAQICRTYVAMWFVRSAYE